MVILIIDNISSIQIFWPTWGGGGWQKFVNHFFDQDTLCGVSKLDARVISLIRPHRADPTPENSVCPPPLRGGQTFSQLDTLCRVSKLDARHIWLIAKGISPIWPPRAEKSPKNSVCPPPDGGSNISLVEIPFVGCLNLMQEISDAFQKESAQTDPPGLRKPQKWPKTAIFEGFWGFWQIINGF